MPTKIMTRLLAGTAVSALLTGAALAAGANARPYDIPQQDAATALQAFAMQSGKQVLFPYEAVKGKSAPQIKGDYSDSEVIALLAQSAGLRVTADDGKTVTLRPQASAAAEGGDEGTVQALVVTAQKREENIQDVPIAMSAFTQEDLTRSQVAGGPDLMTQVPNFTFTKTNFSGYSIQIRGIGTQAISATTDPAVAVAFNNTPFIRNRFFEQEFYDLERVEVLRGPQGTLYGRNATAGVVNILSAKPANHFEARLSGDVSNYGSSRLEGMVNLPLMEDKAALRVAGAWTKRDGFVKNILSGAQTDGRDLWSARVTLGLTPSDRLKADLIYERFQENDDRLRSGKQLCHKDPGPSEVAGMPLLPYPGGPYIGNAVGFFSQGCIPASLYSPDSFQTPNGYALPYFGAAGALGSPIYEDLDPYVSGVQSRNLREIETHIKPEYEAATDTVELQLQYELTDNLTLASETGFNHDHIFSFEDYNRFDTIPNVFVPGTRAGVPDYNKISEDGAFCDPQLGCTTRLALGDLATAESRQFSQEFRLSSSFDGPLNFNLGTNFLKYDSEDKYYVFVNTLTAFEVTGAGQAVDPGINDNGGCYDIRTGSNNGYSWSNPNQGYQLGCAYIDLNNIHSLNDEGRNYFLSRNPYHLVSYAAFGETYWQVTPELKVTAGLRWTVDKKKAPQIPSWLLAAGTYGTPTRKVIHQKWNEPTGRLALDWKPDLSLTDETLIYASYVRGYKAGGANPPPPIPVFPPVGGIDSGSFAGHAVLAESLTHPETFAPEFVSAYEVGTKNTLLDGSLTFNLNAFYYDYTGYQISEIVDRSAVNLNFDAKVWGSELEVDWRPLENLHLGFKGGYENTRLADGSRAVDLMDRTAGMPGWILKKPFPTFPSNCVIPERFALIMGCEGYKLGTDPATGLPFDPVTGLPYVENPTLTRSASGFIVPLNLPLYPNYPGFDTRTAPNNGEGFAKDLSGNQLPNAPTFTATVVADYTLPLANSWLLTLHSDLYYQAEAWTRVFNDPGYDKLKAYSNINLAAIFSNEDAGWQVMAYIKNVLNKDNITGAFLNSDDTGLTSNVFLNEPRLYGLRITKTWTGSSWWSDHMLRGNAWRPFQVELTGEYGRNTGGREILAPDMVTAFPDDHRFPLGVQDDRGWVDERGVKFVYQPAPEGRSIGMSVRYGRALGSTDSNSRWGPPGGYLFSQAQIEFFKTRYPADLVRSVLYMYADASGIANYTSAKARNEESHFTVDFFVGSDVGLGSWRNATSRLNVGLEYAKLNSNSDTALRGRPDVDVPPFDIVTLGIGWHQFDAAFEAQREFQGLGPSASLESSVPMFGDSKDDGLVNAEMSLGGSLLWGKQSADVVGTSNHSYIHGLYAFGPRTKLFYDSPFQSHRTKSVMVPSVNASVGLSYEVGRLKVSGGYRVGRYFNAVDGGLTERKAYDRQVDGPYFKIAVGFGG